MPVEVVQYLWRRLDPLVSRVVQSKAADEGLSLIATLAVTGRSGHQPTLGAFYLQLSEERFSVCQLTGERGIGRARNVEGSDKERR